MAEHREDTAYFDTLLALLPDGELTEAELANVNEYLAQEPEAGLLRDDLAALEDPALWEEPLPVGLHDQIMADAVRTPQTAAKKKHTARRWGGIAAMLAVVILAGSIGLSHLRMGSMMPPTDGAAPEQAWDTAGEMTYSAERSDYAADTPFANGSGAAEAPAGAEAPEPGEPECAETSEDSAEEEADEAWGMGDGAQEDIQTLTTAAHTWLEKAGGDPVPAKEKDLPRDREAEAVRLLR